MEEWNAIELERLEEGRYTGDKWMIRMSLWTCYVLCLLSFYFCCFKFKQLIFIPIFLNLQDIVKLHSEKELMTLGLVTDLPFSKPIPPYIPLLLLPPKPWMLLSNVNCHKIQAIIKVICPQNCLFSFPLPPEAPWCPHILVRSPRSNLLEGIP